MWVMLEAILKAIAGGAGAAHPEDNSTGARRENSEYIAIYPAVTLDLCTQSAPSCIDHTLTAVVQGQSSPSV
ncbi:hypothetical protein P175DRAFT_0530738 [Aspergillus ochraceoroseus IBT 24754]|uniref:Uncharacterized protein n=1 Tax=Aspergillus ochraceoroseus IBT 24754 TaxID=1392256 RepID=A0A2T5M4Y5_9EURO|nr:uncharacterized protein P175DRAFT_0530738 [Aspergillus ochraceoroseus IBT 24754]PTU23603.1 hypothetical protein P175DRAFT_0530738 [Aspergillus ochraceoroseus IBT 24754]